MSPRSRAATASTGGQRKVSIQGDGLVERVRYAHGALLRMDFSAAAFAFYGHHAVELFAHSGARCRRVNLRRPPRPFTSQHFPLL